jgi:hypothetical protein
MAIRIAVGLTVFLIVLVVIMALFVEFAPEGSEVQRLGDNFFDFVDRITPGN